MGEPGGLQLRTARRLTRLFRLERRGRFERLPVATVRRLVERRGSLIDELQRCNWRRRATEIEVDIALRELAAEVDRSRIAARQRRDDLVRAIQYRGHATSGVRSGRAGQLLGRG